MNDRQTKALDKAGAFFAFSQKQFDESKKPGVTYVNGEMGLICPKDTYVTLLRELHNIYLDSITEDLAENGAQAIIIRELNNHEAYYTGDITSTIEALSDYPYPITIDAIQKVFKDKTHDPDYEPVTTSV